jgi:hypothetical protein
MSHGLAVIVALMGLQAQDALGSGAKELMYTRLRTTNPYMAALVREGCARSSTFRQLAEAIQRSNVIVVVQPGLCAHGRIRSCLVSVSGSERARQIGITIDPQHTIANGLIAAIAHELQHAVEIAEHPDVVDARSVIKLYRQIALGHCGAGLSDECETARALETEKTVIVELFRRQGW